MFSTRALISTHWTIIFSKVWTENLNRKKDIADNSDVKDGGINAEEVFGCTGTGL